MAELFTPADDARTRRPDKTYSKHIMLTEFGREKIEAWAKANGLNFSAAIETLALMGLDDERSAYAIPALRATTLQGIRLSFNRIARLLSDIAIEAAASRTMSEGIMLQLIREMAAENPDDFVAMMNISRDGRNQTHTRIRAFHDDITHNVEQDAIRRLKKSVSRVQALFAGDEEEAMHG
ncbi:hypothetical protein [Candidatus Leptofilum sp.]|uniref:hypothetical protein n=1 Tax=Candidatus Leptofilum sp. TaxID=3241576 RepID=UPI003B5BC698